MLANPAPREMPAFLKKILNANDRIICTAKVNDVKKTLVADLLAQRLRIPIFQRRYTWGENQWGTLLRDSLLMVDGKQEKHTLGRLTCTKGGGNGGDRLVVIDGQQRNTTCCLLLAAIRDVSAGRVASDPVAVTLASSLDRHLMPDQQALEAWLASFHDSGKRTIEEGEALEFCALVPTYCDRAAFFAAVLPPRAAVAQECGDWQRPMEAKLYFIKQLKNFSTERLVAVANSVLHRLEWLLFPISLGDGYEDGTEDLHLIYERLAARDATFCRPSRDTEFASMGAADFVRNLLLGSVDEVEAVELYQRYWLPVEMAAAEAAKRHRDSGIAVFLESMLEAFLKAQPEKPTRPLKPQPGQVGGDLYTRFRRWFNAAMEADAGGDTETARVTQVLRRMQEFAVPNLATASLPPPPRESRPGPARAKAIVTPEGKLRCQRCLFPNLPEARFCTTCMQKLG